MGIFSGSPEKRLISPAVGPAYGVLGVTVESEPINGVTAKGSFGVVSWGATASLGVYGFNGSIGTFELESPAVFGADPSVLAGPFGYSSLTIAAGPGISWTAFVMGLGVGKITSFDPSKVVGAELGLDLLSGISYMVPPQFWGAE